MKIQPTTRGNVLQKIGTAVLAILAILMALVALLVLPADDLRLYAPHPHPAADYAEAVQRIEALQAAEVDFNPDCHTTLLTHGARTERTIVFVDGYGSCPASFRELGEQFHHRGYNVLAVPLPYNGLADRMTDEQAKLRAEDLVSYMDQVVDIGRGLGDHLTVVGISAGGLSTGWAAQERQDIDLAVLISPGFGFKQVPGPLTRLASRAFIFLPNMYIWNDSQLKTDVVPDHNYPRISTHSLGQILRLSLATQARMRQNPPAARSILVITNLDEPGVSLPAIDRVVDAWRSYRPAEVQTYEFPADLHLPHGLIDPQEPAQNTVVVYPKLLELIDR
jgi:carboxylesterase